MTDETPIKAYNRRYVVIANADGSPGREILDTKYCSLTVWAGLSTIARAVLAQRLIVTRYPSAAAASEAEDSLNEHAEEAK